MKLIALSVFIILIYFIPNQLPAQKLEPGDGVRITFFNITDDISGDYYIQSNNILQLPHVGLIALDQKDYNTLKNEIVAKYDSLYRGVELIVSPLYKINVLGEVRRPGVYYVTGGLSFDVLKALLIASLTKAVGL